MRYKKNDTNLFYDDAKRKKVEEAGIEPATCRMQSDHSTPELHPLLLLCTRSGDFLVH